MISLKDCHAIRLSLASPEHIRAWSCGEVTKPETLNYRTLRPEKGGLFCERIFGPAKDWVCSCGKYHGYEAKGIVCERCGVLVGRSEVRRDRMGHVELATPVTHPWYASGVPSPLGMLLDLSPRELASVIHFTRYVVTFVDEEARAVELARLDAQLSRLPPPAQGNVGGKREGQGGGERRQRR